MIVPFSDDVNVHVESDPNEALDPVRSLPHQSSTRLSDLGLCHCNCFISLYHHLYRIAFRALQSEGRWVGSLLEQSRHLPSRLEHRDGFIHHHSTASHIT